MIAEPPFRWVFVFILAATFLLSGTFRHRARRSGETIRRAEEGGRFVALRMLFAVPLFGSMLAYAIRPGWMAWSELALPAWLRWLGVGVGLAMLPVLFWVFRSIGGNISETVLTKKNHALITHGPYRWVRHPLYTVASISLTSLGLVAANGFMLAMAVLAWGAVRLFVIPREEAQLVLKFGDSYREYRLRTGKLLPRLRRGA